MCSCQQVDTSVLAGVSTSLSFENVTRHERPRISESWEKNDYYVHYITRISTT